MRKCEQACLWILIHCDVSVMIRDVDCPPVSDCGIIDRDNSGGKNIAWRALARLLRLPIGNWSRDHVKSEDLGGPTRESSRDDVSNSLRQGGEALWNVHRMWQSCIDKEKARRHREEATAMVLEDT